jgi:riboflavin biosynthesis pyrimidine reductase
MDRPRVIIHNLISLDGRLDGFPADAGPYYEMASRLPHQAILTGSGTMLAAAAGQALTCRKKIPSRCLASPRPGWPRPGTRGRCW